MSWLVGLWVDEPTFCVCSNTWLLSLSLSLSHIQLVYLFYFSYCSFILLWWRGISSLPMRRSPSSYPAASFTSLRGARRGLFSDWKRHYTTSSPTTTTAAAGSGAAQTSNSKTSREEGVTEKSEQKGKGGKGAKMPSSKGNPTDPELREEVKEEVKAESKGEIHPHRPRINCWLLHPSL